MIRTIALMREIDAFFDGGWHRNEGAAVSGPAPVDGARPAAVRSSRSTKVGAMDDHDISPRATGRDLSRILARADARRASACDVRGGFDLRSARAA